MSRFAERNPQLWEALEKLSSLVLGSLAFWLLSVPVITAPAALTALFAAVSPIVRGGDDDWFALFWRAFRRSIGRALLLAVLDLVAAALFYGAIRVYSAWGTAAGAVLAYAVGSMAVLAGLINVYAWPLLAWYPQSARTLLRRSFLLAAAHPFGALAGAAVVGVAGFLLLLLPGRLLFLLPLVGPGAVALILGFSAWRGMRRYVADVSEPG